MYNNLITSYIKIQYIWEMDINYGNWLLLIVNKIDNWVNFVFTIARNKEGIKNKC